MVVTCLYIMWYLAQLTSEQLTEHIKAKPPGWRFATQAPTRRCELEELGEGILHVSDKWSPVCIYTARRTEYFTKQSIPIPEPSLLSQGTQIETLKLHTMYTLNRAIH